MALEARAPPMNYRIAERAIKYKYQARDNKHIQHNVNNRINSRAIEYENQTESDGSRTKLLFLLSSI